jgi:hypothetical protein
MVSSLGTPFMTNKRVRNNMKINADLWHALLYNDDGGDDDDDDKNDDDDGLTWNKAVMTSVLKSLLGLFWKIRNAHK